MPSARYRIARWYFKRSVRSQRGMAVPERRAMLDRLAAKLPRARNARVEAVNAGGVPAEWICAPCARADRAILYLHGGYYVAGSLNTHRSLMGRLSKATGARVLLLDYRLAPECPFPAAIEDTVAAYRWLLAQGYAPRQLVIAGDSAGGGLTLSALVVLRDAGLPLPAAGVCLSPCTDLTCAGESMTTRASRDFMVEPEVARVSAQLYLAGADLRNPLASPLYADLAGLPPLLLQVGGDEVLLDDSTRLAACAQAAGVPARLEVWPGMCHEWQQLAGLVPEAGRALANIGRFVQSALLATEPQGGSRPGG